MTSTAQDPTATPIAGGPGPAATTDATAVWRDRLDRRRSLGISPCPNDTFAFHGLLAGLVPGAPAVDVAFADIDVLNGRAERAELDLVKVSYAALPWLLQDYLLLPAGGALGRGCGPLLLTRTGSVPGTGVLQVAVPGLRTTATLLLRLWAAAAGRDLDLVVQPFDTIMPAVAAGTVAAGLVIHESRFTYPDYGLAAVVDLGEWWEADTGLAIPLGAILLRRNDPDPLGVAVAVRASVELAWADPGATRSFVRAHSQEMSDAVCDAHIALYVTGHTADLGDDGYAAVRGLLDRAASAGLAPPVPAALLRFPD